MSTSASATNDRSRGLVLVVGDLNPDLLVWGEDPVPRFGQQERDAVKAVHEDSTVPKDQRRAKMGDIRKDFDGQRRALLNPDQQTKFDELRAKMHDRMRDRHDGQGQDGAPPPPPPAPAAPTDGK